MRFIGDYSAKADAKGRVFLPAPFRRVLEADKEMRLVLRTDLFQKCLVLYPEGLWNEMLDMLRARLNRWDGRHQHLLRLFLEDAEIVELDKNGRFLINKRKLKFAGIICDLEDLIGHKVDLVEEGTLKSYAVESVNRDKKMIYEREEQG